MYKRHFAVQITYKKPNEINCK